MFNKYLFIRDEKLLGEIITLIVSIILSVIYVALEISFKDNIISSILYITGFVLILYQFFSLGLFNNLRKRLDSTKILDRYIVIVFLGISFLLFSIASKAFDLYSFFILIFFLYALIESSKTVSRDNAWYDIFFITALWLILDIRWYNDLWMEDKFSYTWWSLALSTIAIFVLQYIREIKNVNYTYYIKKEYVIDGLIFFIIGFPILSLPGVLLGFVQFPHYPSSGNVLEYILVFIGIFITIAVPEELVFRGTLYNLFEKKYGSKIALIFSSIVFGLTHWNNVSLLVHKIIYVTLASIAGVIYCLAYKKSKSIMASALTHTLVDFVWRLFF